MKDAKGHGSDPRGEHQAGVIAATGPVNYAQFKTVRGVLDAEYESAATKLKSIPGVGSGQMGLTPDLVRATPEYRTAKQAVDRAFQAVRNFNGAHARRFTTEIKADIAAKRAARKG